MMEKPRLDSVLQARLEETEALLEALRRGEVDAVIGDTAVWLLRAQQAQAALRASEARFRDLVEGSIQGVLVHRHFRPLFVNPAYAALFGYTPAEILAMGSTLRLFAPHEHFRLQVYHEARVCGEAAPAYYECQGVRKDGACIWLEMRARVIDWEGAPAAQTVVIDVTERKSAEDEVREANERVRMILDSITDNFFGLDKDWRFTYLNTHAAEQMKVLGKDPARLIGKVLWEEFPYVPNEEALRRVMSERVVITDELYYPPLGEWVENHMYPSPDGGLVTFQKYITARKQAEEKLHHAYETLEQQVQARTAALVQANAELRAEIAERRRAEATQAWLNRELLALYKRVKQDRALKATLLKELNHRVRNNLASLIGILEVERERAHLRTADEALAACAAWLKAIARAHDLLAAAAFAPIDLRDFIDVVAGGIMWQAGAGAPQIDIVYDEVSMKLPPKPFLALACITNELILNAVKHAFNGREHGRIEIRAWGEEDQYVVEVRDDGIGFPAGAEAAGTGLEIVAALCTTDLRGDCRFLRDGGTIARIAFPKAVVENGAEP
jgi:PAS domain S-box-containing protein